MTPQDDRQIVDILVDLYPDSESIEAVTRYAGINTARVDFGGSTQDAWTRVVHFARNRGLLLQLLEQAAKDAPTRDDLQGLIRSEKSFPRHTEKEIDVASRIVEDVRWEMENVERRMMRRMDELDAQIKALRQSTHIYTPRRRAEWLVAFFLFCAPMPLAIHEIRIGLDLALPMAMSFIMGSWVIACYFFMVALGFIRDN